MKTVTAFLLSLVSIATLDAAGWNPEDDTFDPSVESVIANGNSWIGDPSPVHQDGYDIDGYTYVVAKPDQNGNALIWVSLIIPAIPGDTRPPGGATLFLPIEQAETLQGLLDQAITIAGSNDKVGHNKEVGTVVETPGYETWKVMIDGGTDAPVLFHHTRGEDTGIYRLKLNPAKKLLEALTHFLAEGKKVAAE
tara:strand:- start:3614 stop:4195 length:582 start_codon:yes stop_codon:yes gene_type:complete